MPTKEKTVRFVILFEEELAIAAKAVADLGTRHEKATDEEYAELLMNAMQACSVALRGAEADGVKLLLTSKPCQQ